MRFASKESKLDFKQNSSRYRQNADYGSYEARYKQTMEEYWDFQKLPQTEEEAAYERANNDLESMIVQFREELEQLERRNMELREHFGEREPIIAECMRLRQEESRLLKLKRFLFLKK